MTYVKRGARISLLPVSQFCGIAAKLSEEHGAGRAAAMSSAFHAVMANASDAKAKLMRLTDKERAALVDWRAPAPVTVNGHVLTYEDAEKEQPVGITLEGEFASDGEVVTCGTLDFAWVHGGVAYVGDIKKSRWTTSGPDSLQLIAYGYAWAKKHGCHSFCLGLWIVEDAEWQWSERVYEMTSFDALDIWQRILYAALNVTDEASFGDHCKNCYGRLHCPEYTAPAALADTVLSPVAVGGALVDRDKLLALLEYVERVKPMIEKVEEQAKEMARRGEPLKRKGQVLRFIKYKGRESLNRAKLFSEMPHATKYLERGDDYHVARWVKDTGSNR